MKNIRFKAAAAFFLMSVSLPSVSAQSLKSLMRMPFDVVESKWEINSTNGNQELNYYNKDFCDYYLYRQQDTSYDLSPGKTPSSQSAKTKRSTIPSRMPPTIPISAGVSRKSST